MTPNTTTDSSGMAATNTRAAFASTVNAMIMAPNTINGDRRKRRSTRLTPDCTWLTSLVSLVIRVDVPIASISVNERPWMWTKRACLTPAPKPAAAFAEKYCAVIEQISPVSPSAISTKHILTIYALSLPAMPTSITAAITSGTSSSKDASSILKRGASIDSFLYFFR